MKAWKSKKRCDHTIFEQNELCVNGSCNYSSELERWEKAELHYRIAVGVAFAGAILFGIYIILVITLK